MLQSARLVTISNKEGLEIKELELLFDKKKCGRKKLSFVAVALITLGLLTACNGKPVQQEEVKKFESTDIAMGTVISQRVFGDNGQAAIDAALEKIKSLEALLTFNAPGGDVNKLNDYAGKQSVELQPETLLVLKESQEVAELSGGAFDVTVGPIVKSWGIGTDNARIPSETELKELLPLVNYKNLLIEGNTAYLKQAGQMVDLGGIAKGYAGDAAIEVYKKQGITSAFINLGGNVVTLGTKPDGSSWTVGVRNPRPAGEEDQIVGMITVADKAVVTAGDDQRYFEVDGVRYHHILNPHTGYPAQSDLMSVTLVTDSSLLADALDTAVYILGLEKGREMLENYGGVEAVFITRDKKIYVTDGLKDSFEFFDESKEYEFVKD
ncbi:thiamine biosynthesis lipoprotein [Desulfitobacterium sp. LBE]|uniref:FAD:protein FMN transferase n=4 Tax=root TaxID=1 RepID=A0A098B6T8_DESHA|nr:MULTISPECIES: FAD:protein FMN transferase [Desulfitobacterium]ACL19551.1 ApbE family lipoprotein [Desulfitobacterium hafniense DCB-2]EHL04090.1 ApbE family protein [Desulfitobacterium hafniense DP7]MEA5023523.1 FAD:protein FMN transferase [Desulfitobacterium hafniense]TWH57612.1 thiamine biosynthesis lipoprotein [Desulfitobacterium sp. LBE]CDX04095.1 Thiamine biosynthesis lipoprotein ApbE [Desulfitobacterium hafniense]